MVNLPPPFFLSQFLPILGANFSLSAKIFCASNENVLLVFSLADCTLEKQLLIQENWI